MKYQAQVVNAGFLNHQQYLSVKRKGPGIRIFASLSLGAISREGMGFVFHEN